MLGEQPVGLEVVLAITMRQAPRLTASVAERQQRRSSRLSWLAGTPPLLSGLEDGYRLLLSVQKAIPGTALDQIAPLVERIQGEYEEMFEAFLAGELFPLEDAARTIMEAEWLLRCFVDDPPLVALWGSSSAEDRRKLFSPAALRKRLEQVHHQGLEMPDAEE